MGSVRAPDILKLLRNLSKDADQIIYEDTSKINCISDWFEIVKKRAVDIMNEIPGEDCSISEAVPSLVSSLEGPSRGKRRQSRVSAVIKQMKVDHLHASKSPTSSSQQKRKSSVPNEKNETSLKKPKLAPILRKSMRSAVLNKVSDAKNSPVVAKKSEVNLKSSVGATSNLSVKGIRALPIITKENKASENRKKAVEARRLKMQENAKLQEEKRLKMEQYRLKLRNEKLEKFQHCKETRATPEVKNTNQSEVIKKKAVTSVPKDEEKKSRTLSKNNKNVKMLKSETPTPIAKSGFKDIMNTTRVIKSAAKGPSDKAEVHPSALISQEKVQKTSKAMKKAIPPICASVESYAVTPPRESFVSYDISEINSDDSEEETEHNSKPIPAWACSVRLRNALLQQHHKPIDTDALFGNFVETPDLTAIMGVKKSHYQKRTSSAIWGDISLH